MKIIDGWSCERCSFGDDETLVSMGRMLDFLCSKCGKTMNLLNI